MMIPTEEERQNSGVMKHRTELILCYQREAERELVVEMKHRTELIL